MFVLLIFRSCINHNGMAETPTPPDQHRLFQATHHFVAPLLLVCTLSVQQKTFLHQ